MWFFWAPPHRDHVEVKHSCSPIWEQGEPLYQNQLKNWAVFRYRLIIKKSDVTVVCRNRQPVVNHASRSYLIITMIILGDSWMSPQWNLQVKCLKIYMSFCFQKTRSTKKNRLSIGWESVLKRAVWKINDVELSLRQFLLIHTRILVNVRELIQM